MVGFCKEMVKSLESLVGKEDRNFKIVISLAAKWLVSEILIHQWIHFKIFKL